MLRMTKELNDSVKESTKENSMSFLKDVQIAYPTSAALNDANLRNRDLKKAGQPEGDSLYSGDMYFYDGKDEDEKVMFTPLGEEIDLVVVDIRGFGEAWKGIKPKAEKKSVETSISMSFDPECPAFTKRPEFKDFLSEIEEDDTGNELVVKLSHRVLIYIPSLDTFATMYFKWSTTEDYAQLLDCVGEDGNVIKAKVYTQDLKGSGVWHRFRFKDTGKQMVVSKDADVFALETEEAKKKFEFIK